MADFLFYLLCIVGGLMAAVGVVLLFPAFRKSKPAPDEQGPKSG